MDWNWFGYSNLGLGEKFLASKISELISLPLLIWLAALLIIYSLISFVFSSLYILIISLWLSVSFYLNYVWHPFIISFSIFISIFSLSFNFSIISLCSFYYLFFICYIWFWRVSICFIVLYIVLSQSLRVLFLSSISVCKSFILLS